MKLFNSARPLAFCFALGACTASGTAEYVEYDAVGVPRLFKSVAASGSFPTVVHGNSSGNAKATFDTAVIDAMGEYVWGQKSNFTLTAPDAAWDSYRVVMVFSGVRHFGGKAACRDVDATALIPITEAVGLQAAFCHNDKVLSQAHLRFDANQADGDAMTATEYAVAQAVLAIFPLHDKSREAPDVVVPPP
jgi:hypothetical protein